MYRAKQVVLVDLQQKVACSMLTTPEVYGLFGLLSIIALAVMVLAIRSLREPTTSIIAREIQLVLDQLGQRVQDFVQFNSLKTLVEEFTERPEMMANLKGYSRQAVAAALFQRVSCLTATIQSLQEQLSKAQFRLGQDSNIYGDEPRITRLTKVLADLYQDLDEANEAVQKFADMQTV